jgi:hypothetical protein
MSTSHDSPFLPVPLSELCLPWRAWLIPVGEYPATPDQRKETLALLQAVKAPLLASPQWHHELLLQVWAMAPERGSEQLNDNVAEWWPTQGMGVWPDRNPPENWTEEKFADSMAAAYRGEPFPALSHRLLRLNVNAETRPTAVSALHGSGALLEILAASPFEELRAKARETYLPRIHLKRFQRENFYFPLLDIHTIQSARSVVELDDWMCGISLYLRESDEDHGVLIVSREHLEAIQMPKVEPQPQKR